MPQRCVAGATTINLIRGRVVPLIVLVAALSLIAAACGSSNSSSSHHHHPTPTPTPTPSASLSGTVEGGGTPISDSSVALYEVGTSGYGAGAISLGTATTDSTGAYTISYNAPATPAVLYLVASGGNAGVGANGSIGMLGVAGLSNALPVLMVVNEFTTVGAEWALHQFIDPSGETIGAPTTNAAGFNNAFLALESNLVNLSGGTPGALLDSIAATCGTATPAVNCSTLEQMNTLANILAACVTSSGSGSSQCSTLFTNATPPGGAAPLTTLVAVADIVRNPTNNVAALFGLQTGSSSYAPSLSVAPNDLTLALNFAQASANFSSPIGVALDGAGNVFVANDTHNSVSELTVASAYNTALNFTTASAELDPSWGIAIDSAANVFVANPALGSVSELVAPNYGADGINLKPGAQFDDPYALALDSSGNIFVANRASPGSITELVAPDYGTNANNFAPEGAELSDPTSIAIDSSGNVWAPNSFTSDGELGDSVSELTAASGYMTGINFGPSTGADFDEPFWVSFDSAGNLWVANGGSSSVSELTAASNYESGNNITPTGANLDAPDTVVVDGASDLWLANTGNGSVSELPASNYSAGFNFQPPGSDFVVPSTLAIDESGNLWITNVGDSVTELIGAAVPVTTPLKPGGPILP